ALKTSRPQSNTESRTLAPAAPSGNLFASITRYGAQVFFLHNTREQTIVSSEVIFFFFTTSPNRRCLQSIPPQCCQIRFISPSRGKEYAISDRVINVQGESHRIGCKE